MVIMVHQRMTALTTFGTVQLFRAVGFEDDNAAGVYDDGTYPGCLGSVVLGSVLNFIC